MYWMGRPRTLLLQSVFHAFSNRHSTEGHGFYRALLWWWLRMQHIRGMHAHTKHTHTHTHTDTHTHRHTGQCVWEEELTEASGSDKCQTGGQKLANEWCWYTHIPPVPPSHSHNKVGEWIVVVTLQRRRHAQFKCTCLYVCSCTEKRQEITGVCVANCGRDWK